VKSAPMKACSMPIHTVIGISSCWLGFFSWYAVADSSCIPVSSALSARLCFSPYLKGDAVYANAAHNRYISNTNRKFIQQVLLCPS
jgi:hypothetical protein